MNFIARWLILRKVKDVLSRLPKEAPVLNLLRALLTSKKAAAFIAGVAVLALRQFAGLDEATASKIVNLVMAYLFSQGAVDVALALKGLKLQ